MTYYEAFELPLTLSIDLKDLEKRFYASSRKWHPDMFARKSAEEKQQSLDMTALLNDAYRTLKDPIARALYVLKLEGYVIAEHGTKDVPPELLEEVFELNMALEELRGGDEDAKAQLVASKHRFETMRDELDRTMQQQFVAWDLNRDRAKLDQIRGQLNRRKYITNLIARTEEAHVSD